MYAVQYRNVSMARHLLAESETGRGLDACRACQSCRAHCRNTVQIARKITQLKELQLT
jgi:succinate dehydrogenase/fumarate reductase-like Fe-S protein